MLTVVVASMAERSRGAHDLRGELSLTRSAALYADHVVLLSPYVGVAQQIASEVVQETAVSPTAMLAALKSQRPDLYEALRAEQEPDVLLHTLMATVQMQHEVPEVAAAVEEIGRAEASGFVSTHRPAADVVPHSLAETTIDRLFELLLDPSVHVICDTKASQVIRGLAAAGDKRVSSSVVQRNREAELGAGLIARLPAFPDARLSDLLEVKAELKGPVDRYRAAVATLERDLADVGVGDALDADVERVWRRVVAPALSELEEALIEHSFVHELGRSLGRSAKDVVLAGAALSVAAASVAQLAASVSAAAGVVGASAQVIASGALEHVAHRRSATKADFYYLQQLSRRIEQMVGRP